MECIEEVATLTRNFKISLDLNENDLEAIQTVLAKKTAVAKVVAPADCRLQARIVDVLDDISLELAQVLVQEVSTE